MTKGRWCIVVRASVGLMASLLTTACQTPVVRGDSCSTQIEGLRAEVRAIEARQKGEPKTASPENVTRSPPAYQSANIARSLSSYETMLQKQLEADMQQNGSDEQFAIDAKRRFARWLGEKSLIRCGRKLCRVEAMFDKQSSYAEFSAQALVGCGAVWHGELAITRAPGLDAPPRAPGLDAPPRAPGLDAPPRAPGPLAFVMYLRKPEQQPPRTDATPCDAATSTPMRKTP